jgi:hypothetical protein
MSWDKIIDKKVKSSDNEDMGKVESVAANYVEVKERALHKKRYFVPGIRWRKLTGLSQ